MGNLVYLTTSKQQLTNMLFVLLSIISFNNNVCAQERGSKFLISNIQSVDSLLAYEDYILDELNSFRSEDQFCLPQQTLKIIQSLRPYRQEALLNLLGQQAVEAATMYTETNSVAESIATNIVINDGELPEIDITELLNDEINFFLTATNVQMFHWTGGTMWPTPEQLQNVFQNIQNCHAIMQPLNLPHISVGIAEGDGEWVSVVLLFDMSKGGR